MSGSFSVRSLVSAVVMAFLATLSFAQERALAQRLVGGNFPISTAPNSQSSPAVAFDGTNYLVVWTDTRTTTPLFDMFGLPAANSDWR